MTDLATLAGTIQSDIRHKENVVRVLEERLEGARERVEIARDGVNAAQAEVAFTQESLVKAKANLADTKAEWLRKLTDFVPAPVGSTDGIDR
jgi:hypothetical protein